MSIIPFSTWRSNFPDIPLQSSAIQLKTYTNGKLSVLGQHDVTVRYGDQVQKLIITVVGETSQSIRQGLAETTTSKLDTNFNGSKLFYTAGRFDEGIF